MGFDFHTGLRRGGTSGDDTESFNIDEAESAGTVNAQLGMITEGWNVDADFSGEFQQVAFVVKSNRYAVDCQIFRSVSHIKQTGATKEKYRTPDFFYYTSGWCFCNRAIGGGVKISGRYSSSVYWSK